MNHCKQAPLKRMKADGVSGFEVCGAGVSGSVGLSLELEN